MQEFFYLVGGFTYNFERACTAGSSFKGLDQNWTKQTTGLCVGEF